MGKKKILANQQGFTLIEIIAVLVLLGILAAVAVPKYMSMQSQAELKSIAGVKAELASRSSQYHGQYLLDQTNGTYTTLSTQLESAWAAEDVGNDFTLNGTDGGGVIKVKVGSTSKCYQIAFTAGTATSPAEFGAITALDPCGF